MKIEYQKKQNTKQNSAGTAGLIRNLLLAWLTAATAEFLLIPAQLRSMNGLQGVAAMSFPRLLIVAGIVFALLEGLSRLLPHGAERWMMVGC